MMCFQCRIFEKCLEQLILQNQQLKDENEALNSEVEYMSWQLASKQTVIDNIAIALEAVEERPTFD